MSKEQKTIIGLEKYYDSIYEIISTKTFDQKSVHPFLMGGKAGIALFFAEDYRINHRVESFARLESILEQLLAQLSEHIRHYSFAHGLSGIGWLIRYLKAEDLLDNSLDETLDELDTIIIEYTKQQLDQGYFDYLHEGLSGYLYFNFEVAHISTYKRFNKTLMKSVVREDEGLYWESIDKQNPQRRYINLGLSHGIPGILVILARVYEISPSTELKTTLYGLINTIRKIQSEHVVKGCQFPNGFLKGKENVSQNPSRLAWCYGDLGISIALLQVGNILQDVTIIKEAEMIGLKTCSRKLKDDTSVMDAGLCHGTAGIAHIYNRMFKYTKNPLFKEAAEFWMQQTLEYASFNDGLAGFKRWSVREEKYINDYSFLEGIAGIGLSLLGYMTDENPKWDRALLLS